MQKKQKLILIIGGAVIVILGIILFLIPGPKKAGAPSSKTAQTGINASGTASNGLPQSETNTPVPANITVPNEGAKNVASNIAVPKIQAPAAPGSSLSSRLFDISINNNKFIPDTVIAYVGDTVNMQITAVDKDYDFTQPDNGLKQIIPKGQTKTVAISPMSTGKFMFYCESCGGPNKGPVGYLIVK